MVNKNNNLKSQFKMIIENFRNKISKKKKFLKFQSKRSKSRMQEPKDFKSKKKSLVSTNFHEART